PLLDLGNQPGIVPRLHRHILHDWKSVEIVQAAGDELIAALGALRRRRDHKAGAQNIDWDISVGPDSAALTVMPIPGLEMPRARSRDQRRQAVATAWARTRSSLESQSSEVMPLRLPHMKPIAGALANLPAILALPINPNFS